MGYQFSEEIIQTHFYDSDMPEGKLDRLRGRIGKWLYLAQRQSFLRNTKRCGFYNDGLEHGGPSGREDTCKGIKQIMTGFRKWADRYIGGCGGQANHKHQVNRANKFYGIFRDGLNCPA